MGQQLRIDAEPGVTHAKRHHTVVHRRIEPDLAAFFRIFGGVVEQIGDHLRKAREIRLEQHRLLGQLHGQVMLAQADQRPAGLDGVLHDFRELHRLLLQSDLSTHHSRDVE